MPCLQGPSGCCRPICGGTPSFIKLPLERPRLHVLKTRYHQHTAELMTAAICRMLAARQHWSFEQQQRHAGAIAEEALQSMAITQAKAVARHIV